MKSSPLLDFSAIDWQEDAPGFRSKSIDLPNARLRLVEISDAFEEKDWCTNAHLGYVLEGRLYVRFSDHTQCFQKGDGLHIEAGEVQRHKAFVMSGEQVQLILFD